tara:strand:+ start:342 stop:725 length:384 start_codon:yes stop_codon:yes gene_type:complete
MGAALRKGGKLRKRLRGALRKGGKRRKSGNLRKGAALRKSAKLRMGAALVDAKFGVPERTIRSARGLKSSRVGQQKGYGLDGQARSSRRSRLGKEPAAAVAAPSSRSRALLALVVRRQTRTNGSGPH